MDKLKRLGETTAEVECFLKQWSDDKDYVIAHTSGSTGAPKEIHLKKADMEHSALQTCQFLGIGKNSVMGLVLSADYIAGKMMIVRSLLMDSSLWVERPSLAPLKECECGYPIDLLAVVPAQLSGLISSGRIGNIRNLLIGGAALSQRMEQQLLDFNVKAFVTYGMTETCSHVALRSIGSKYYKALGGITFSTERDNRLVIDCPDFSFKRVVTNDIVRLIDDTTFQWLGRKDNVINSGGVKLHPEEIEKKIAGLFNDREFYITSRESKQWGHEIVLVIESDYDDSTDVKESISSRLSRYEIPKDIIYVKKFGRTTSGKVIRKKF